MPTISLVQITIEPSHNSFTYIKQLNQPKHTEAFVICLYICPSFSYMYIHLKQSINHFKQQQSLDTHTHTQSLFIFQYYDSIHMNTQGK
jgi:hypothetical protein